MRSKSTGSIRKRERNGVITWEGRLTVGYDPGTGKRLVRSVYGKTQREVQQKMNDLIYEVEHNRYIAPIKMTVGQWMDEYLDTYCRDQLKPYTIMKYESDTKNYIKPYLGSIPLQDVSGKDLQKMANGMIRKGLSVKTVRCATGLCHKAFDTAIKLGYLDTNPADKITVKKAVKEEVQPLTDAEIPRFLEAIRGDRFENAFAISLFGGLREGECLGLSWRQVDLEKGTLLIDQQLQRRKEGFVVVPSTKSSRPRTVHLPQIAIGYLKDEELKQKKARLRAGKAWLNDESLVFTDELGLPSSIGTYYKHFKKIAASIGRPDARPHDLRHTAATVAISAGSDIKSVQEMLGHATASFTLNVYAHASDRMMQDTAARMQDYYESLHN